MQIVCEGESQAKKKRVHKEKEKNDSISISAKIAEEQDVWLPLVASYLDAKSMTKFVDIHLFLNY